MLWRGWFVPTNPVPPRRYTILSSPQVSVNKIQHADDRPARLGQIDAGEPPAGHIATA